MARNWNVKDFVQALNGNEDERKEAMLERL